MAAGQQYAIAMRPGKSNKLTATTPWVKRARGFAQPPHRQIVFAFHGSTHARREHEELVSSGKKYLHNARRATRPLVRAPSTTRDRTSASCSSAASRLKAQARTTKLMHQRRKRFCGGRRHEYFSVLGQQARPPPPAPPAGLSGMLRSRQARRWPRSSPSCGSASMNACVGRCRAAGGNERLSVPRSTPTYRSGSTHAAELPVRRNRYRAPDPQGKALAAAIRARCKNGER